MMSFLKKCYAEKIILNELFFCLACQSANFYSANKNLDLINIQREYIFFGLVTFR